MAQMDMEDARDGARARAPGASAGDGRGGGQGEGGGGGGGGGWAGKGGRCVAPPNSAAGAYVSLHIEREMTYVIKPSTSCATSAPPLRPRMHQPPASARSTLVMLEPFGRLTPGTTPAGRRPPATAQAAATYAAASTAAASYAAASAPPLVDGARDGALPPLAITPRLHSGAIHARPKMAMLPQV